MSKRIGSNRYIAAFATVFAVILSSSVMADVAEIVRDRAARAYILLGPEAHALEKESATDLQRAIKQATGIEIKLLETPPATDRLIPIRIGQAAVAAANMADKPAWAELPYDGAVVEVEAKAINVAGPTPAGTANGVATILLEDVGLRMYYPDPLFTIVPRVRSIAIRSRTVKPSFDYRVWSGVVGSEAAAYQRRNRLSDRRIAVPYFGFGHNLGRIIPVEKYGASHPEYFAFRNGARRPEGTGVGHATQPCFTNADVIRLTIEAARAYFDKNPDRNTFSLCVNDNARYCECEKCAAMDKPYRNLPVGRQYSESYFDYVSKVAEAVAESHPQRYLGVYAYWNVEQPPRNRKRLPDNVIVALTLDILQHYDAAYKGKDQQLIRDWSGYANRLHTYVYYGLGWYTPRMSPQLVAEDLRFQSDNGVRAIYCEVYPFWAWCGPMHYVAGRLQWNVNEDANAILDEFHHDCFGEVAAEMRAYHDACERYWTRARPGRWFEGLDRLGPEEAMADLGLLHEAQRHLDEALSRAKDRKVRDRIQWLQKGFDFTMAIGQAFEAKKAEAEPVTRLKNLISAAKAVEAAYRKIANDPAYKHAYYQPGGRFDRKCWGWFKQPVLTAAKAHWEQLQSSVPAEEVEAKWKVFERRSGLRTLLQKRGWELDLPKPSK